MKKEICSTCPLRTANICSVNKQGEVVKDFIYKGEERKKGEIRNGCGCELNAKRSSPKSKCPLGKWPTD